MLSFAWCASAHSGFCPRANVSGLSANVSVFGLCANVCGFSANVIGLSACVCGFSAIVHGLCAYVRGLSANVCGLSAKVDGLSASVLIVFARRHVLAFLDRCLRLRVVVRRVLWVASHAPRPQCRLLL